MTRSKKRTLITVISSFILVGWCGYLLFQNLKKNEIINRFEENNNYMYVDSVVFFVTNRQYACGECAHFFSIDSVIYAENQELSYYFNKEISINDLELMIDKGKVLKTYKVNGVLQRNNFGSYRLINCKYDPINE